VRTGKREYKIEYELKENYVNSRIPSELITGKAQSQLRAIHVLLFIYSSSGIASPIF